MNTIFLGADHAATTLKESLKHSLDREGYTIEDVSPLSPEGGDDYPEYAFAVAKRVAADPRAVGILVCDTGIGMAIAANKVPGVFAALATNTFMAKRAREHNNANILVLGSEETSTQEAMDMARVFLTTAFSNADRHVRRLGKIRYYEQHDRNTAHE